MNCPLKKVIEKVGKNYDCDMEYCMWWDAHREICCIFSILLFLEDNFMNDAISIN